MAAGNKSAATPGENLCWIIWLQNQVKLIGLDHMVAILGEIKRAGSYGCNRLNNKAFSNLQLPNFH